MKTLGDFVVSLKIKPDDTGAQKVGKLLSGIRKEAVQLKDDFKNTAESMIGMAGKIGLAFVALKVIADKSLDLSKGAFSAGGMDTAKFEAWGKAAKVAGGSAEAMNQSLIGLNKAFQDLKGGDSSKLEGLAKAFGMTTKDTNFMAILRMAPEARALKIAQLIEGSKDKQFTYNELDKAGLSGFVDLEKGAGVQGTTGSALYARQMAFSLESAGKIDKVAGASGTFNQTAVNVEAIGKMIADSMILGAKGPLDSFNDWMLQNKASLERFGDAIGKIASALGDLLVTLAKFGFGDTKTGSAGLFSSDEEKKAMAPKMGINVPLRRLPRARSVDAAAPKL